MIKSRKVGLEDNVARMGRNARANRALVSKPKEQGDGRTFFQSQYINAITFCKKVERGGGGNSATVLVAAVENAKRCNVSRHILC